MNIFGKKYRKSRGRSHIRRGYFSLIFTDQHGKRGFQSNRSLKKVHTGRVMKLKVRKAVIMLFSPFFRFTLRHCRSSYRSAFAVLYCLVCYKRRKSKPLVTRSKAFCILFPQKTGVAAAFPQLFLTRRPALCFNNGVFRWGSSRRFYAADQSARRKAWSALNCKTHLWPMGCICVFIRMTKSSGHGLSFFN